MSNSEYSREQFEQLWSERRMQLLRRDSEYREAAEQFKMTSAADVLLFVIPVIVGIVSIDYLPLQSELLRYFVSAVITVAAFVLCVWAKSLALGGSRSVADIERRVKERCYREYMEKGYLNE
jgi:hypothetical protein